MTEEAILRIETIRMKREYPDLFGESREWT